MSGLSSVLALICAGSLAVTAVPMTAGAAAEKTDVSDTEDAVAIGPVRNADVRSSFDSFSVAWSPPEGRADLREARLCLQSTQSGWCKSGTSPIVAAWADLPISDREQVFALQAVVEPPETAARVLLPITRPLEPPPPPTDLRSSAGATFVELTWSAPEKVLIDAYDVSWGAGALTVTSPRARIEGLNPNTSYRFQVSARGATGPSRPAEVSARTTLGPADLRPDVPGAVRDLSLALAADATHVIVTWSAPASDGGSPLQSYLLAMNGEEPQVLGAEVFRQRLDVESGKTIEISVRAVNQMGASAPSTRSITTPKGPPGTPQNLRLTPGASLSAVELEWDAPHDGGSPITSYTIRYNDPGSLTPIGVQTEAVRTEIRPLAPGQRYRFEVVATNARGSSSRPATLAYQVPFDPQPAPEAPGPVRDLEVVRATDSSLSLRWRPPASAASDPVVSSYRVLVPGREAITVPTASAVITDLEPSRPYVIQVIARNSVGDSVPVLIAARTDAGPPGPPRGVIAVPRGSLTDMALSWLPPESSGGTPVTGYRVWWGTGEQVVADTEAFITGLAPATRYTFRVSSLNAVGVSLPAEVVATTPLSPIPRPQPPSPPRDLTVTGATAQSLALDWREPADVGGSGLRYTVEVEGRTPVTVTQTAYLATGLEPNREYAISVRAVNQMGSSDAVTARGLTTKAPPDSVTNLRATRGASLRTVQIDWDPPVSDGGSPIREYSVSWVDGSTTTQVPSATVEVPTTGAAYTFRVTAINDQGSAPPAQLRYVTPLDPVARPDVPGVPTDLEVVATTSTSATIRWQPPAKDGGSPIEEYRVFVPGRPAISVERPLLTITDLMPNRDYSFSVVARNRMGDSTAAIVGARTRIGLPSEPRDLAVSPSGSRGFLVRWQPPADLGGGTLLSYRVQWGGDEALVGALELLVSDLEPGTRYRFRVSAVNEAGDSQPAVGIGVTVLDPQQRPRPSPPQGVAVTGATPTTIALSWRASGAEEPPPVTAYRVDDGAGREYTVSSTSVLLRGLNPNTEYAPSVRAVSAMGESVPVTITARTPAGSPEPPKPGPAPSPQPQPFSPPLPAGLEESDLDLDGDPLTVRQTAPGQWPKQRVDRSGRPLPIEKFSGFVTNAGQTAKLTVTKKSPSVASVKLSRDRKSRAWVMTATLRPGTVSGSVILTVSAPATQAKGVRYEPLQSSQQFLVRR